MMQLQNSVWVLMTRKIAYTSFSNCIRLDSGVRSTLEPPLSEMVEAVSRSLCKVCLTTEDVNPVWLFVRSLKKHIVG